jgi:hypothetical protein
VSYVFEIDDATVWSPALQVGDVFRGYVEVLEKVLGVPAGVSEFAGDYLILDRETFAGFVREVHRFWASGHPVGTRLAEPVLAVALVMLERAGEPLDLDPPGPDLSAVRGIPT